MKTVDLEALTNDLAQNTDWDEHEAYRTPASRRFELELVSMECYVGAVVYVMGDTDIRAFANGAQTAIPFWVWSEFFEIVKRNMTEQLTERTS